MKQRRPSASRDSRSDNIVRGQVWYVDLGDPIGHEAGFDRPFLVISVDQFNDGGAGVILGVPITSKDHEVPLHVRFAPPEGGVTSESFLQPEGLRSISKERLRRAMGHVGSETLDSVEDAIRILLGL